MNNLQEDSRENIAFKIVNILKERNISEGESILILKESISIVRDLRAQHPMTQQRVDEIDRKIAGDYLIPIAVSICTTIFLSWLSGLF